MSFLHGIEVIELDVGTRPIQTSRSSIIGLVGTAGQGPIQTPTLIAGSRKEAIETFGSPGMGYTIPDALDAILDQTGALVVVINVLDPENAAFHSATDTDEVLTFDASNQITLANHDFAPATLQLTSQTAPGAPVTLASADYTIEGNVITLTASGLVALDEGTSAENHEVEVSYKRLDPTQVDPSHLSEPLNAEGDYIGVQALLAAESTVQVAPRLLIAPGFTGLKNTDPLASTDPTDMAADPNYFDPSSITLVQDLLQVANRLRAIVIADGPNATDEASIAFRQWFNDARLYLVDPHVKVFDSVSGQNVMQPASSRVAGIIAKSDAERGFWYSPSNRTMDGIVGTSRAIDFTMGDPNSRANLLNENEVATIIHQNGYRLWGNRSTATEPKFAFISTRRIADLINDALLRSHLWAVDQNITASYVQSVVDGVNNYLRYLQSLGAILGGQCYADPEVNTPDQIAQGKVTFDFDFTPPYPAERITFRSRLVNTYLEEVI